MCANLFLVLFFPNLLLFFRLNDVSVDRIATIRAWGFPLQAYEIEVSFNNFGLRWWSRWIVRWLDNNRCFRLEWLTFAVNVLGLNAELVLFALIEMLNCRFRLNIYTRTFLPNISAFELFFNHISVDVRTTIIFWWLPLQRDRCFGRIGNFEWSLALTWLVEYDDLNRQFLFSFFLQRTEK